MMFSFTLKILSCGAFYLTMLNKLNSEASFHPSFRFPLLRTFVSLRLHPHRTRSLTPFSVSFFGMYRPRLTSPTPPPSPPPLPLSLPPPFVPLLLSSPCIFSFPRLPCRPFVLRPPSPPPPTRPPLPPLLRRRRRSPVRFSSLSLPSPLRLPLPSFDLRLTFPFASSLPLDDDMGFGLFD